VSLDPRLVIGLALVVGSVAGVVTIITSTDRSVQVYAARGPLSPGDRIDANDLELQNVRLDVGSAVYLTPSDIPHRGIVVTRSVSEGELIPVSATGSVAGLTSTSIVLSVDSQLAASIRSGAVVDIWAGAEIENGVFGPPIVIVSDATVVRLVSSDSIVGGGDTTAVEVLVPKLNVAQVLEAVANDDAISIIPANLPNGS
jgi:hypothetical protein